MKQVLNEVRKEDDFYFVGTFWIVGKSISDILHGNLLIVGEKHLVDYEGKAVGVINRNALTHKRLWRDDEEIRNKAAVFSGISTEDYTYFPRGRIAIFEGQYYLFLPSEVFNNGKVINAIYSFYSVSSALEMNIEYNDVSDEERKGQAVHYQPKLQ